MHERNLYKTPPDFESLARVYPPLQRHIIRTPGNGLPTIDFYDETAQKRLTQALLYRDFDIQLNIPDDRLCPPVPNRLNYVLWLQDIVSHSSVSGPLSSIRGIDIGTGASAIYPLIACRLAPNWNFVATDIDDVSLASARSNIDSNGLSERIVLLRTDPTGPVMFPLIHDRTTSFNFSMCNPPFYASAEEATSLAAAKEHAPNAVCTGTEVEMITPGGEEAFVNKMVRESITLGERCQWYTSMLGKQSSLTALVTLLRSHSITNYAIAELIQGHTRRWVLAWSFADTRLPDDLARPNAPALRRLLPPRTIHRQPLHYAPPEGAIRSVLFSLESEYVSVSVTGDTFCVIARRDTWSRSARRKARPQNPDPATATKEEEVRIEAVLVVHVWVEECAEEGVSANKSEVQLVVQWKRGRDAQTFESFASHVGRKLREAAPKV